MIECIEVISRTIVYRTDQSATVESYKECSHGMLAVLPSTQAVEQCCSILWIDPIRSGTEFELAIITSDISNSSPNQSGCIGETCGATCCLPHRNDIPAKSLGDLARSTQIRQSSVQSSACWGDMLAFASTADSCPV
jgi:hypothetical protein